MFLGESLCLVCVFSTLSSKNEKSLVHWGGISRYNDTYSSLPTILPPFINANSSRWRDRDASGFESPTGQITFWIVFTVLDYDEIFPSLCLCNNNIRV